MTTEPRSVAVRHTRERILRPVFLFAGFLVALIALFLIAPWSFQDKAIATLHGLCAQTPENSFWFGDVRLPFDSRMTGIYGGFLMTSVYLLARGRLYRVGLPPVSFLVLMVFFIAAMGIDGFNSMFTGLGWPNLYEPSNYLRFATGAMTGTSLSVMLWLLFNSVIWNEQVLSYRPVIIGWLELIPIALMITLWGVIVASGVNVLFPLISLIQIISGLLVVSIMTMVVFQSARGKVNTLRFPAELARPAIPVVIISLTVMASFSTLRAIAERIAGV